VRKLELLSINEMNRHFIFTSGRSGSNYLSNTLNNSPDCVNYGEVLGEWTLPFKLIGRFLCNDLGAEKYFRVIYSSKVYFFIAQVYSVFSHLRGQRKINYKARRKVSSIGVKDFLVTMERRKGFDFLRSNNDIKVIYLYRRNILKKYISGVFMSENKLASSYSEVSIEPIDINVDAMLSNLEIMTDEARRERTFISSLRNQVLTIEYEEYFESGESKALWNTAAFNFLGVEPVDIKSGQKKILPDRLKDVVNNYDEVLVALAGSEYEAFLY